MRTGDKEGKETGRQQDVVQNTFSKFWHIKTS